MDSLEFINEQIRILNAYIKDLKKDINKYQRLLEASGDPLNEYSIKSCRETISYVQEKIKHFKQLRKELRTTKKPRVEKVLWATNSTSDDYIINHYCPNCNEPLNKFKNNFCNICGIKIDWSEEEC